MGRGAQWSAEEEAKMFCIDTVQDETRLWVDSGVPRGRQGQGQGQGQGDVAKIVGGKGKVMVASGVAVDKLGAEFPGWLQWSDLVVLRAVLWRQSCGFLEAEGKGKMRCLRKGLGLVSSAVGKRHDQVKGAVQCCRQIVASSWLATRSGIEGAF